MPGSLPDIILLGGAVRNWRCAAPGAAGGMARGERGGLTGVVRAGRVIALIIVAGGVHVLSVLTPEHTVRYIGGPNICQT